MYNDTYHNNTPYGSPVRPLIFCKAEKKKITVCEKQKEVLVISTDKPFFDEFKCGCRYCRTVYAKFDFCLDWNIALDVYLTDDGCNYYGLESENKGFILSSEQIQPFCGYGFYPIPMTLCYQEDNNHITIAKYYPKHQLCDCDSSDSKVEEEPIVPDTVVAPTATSAKTK